MVHRRCIPSFMVLRWLEVSQNRSLNQSFGRKKERKKNFLARFGQNGESITFEPRGIRFAVNGYGNFRPGTSCTRKIRVEQRNVKSIFEELENSDLRLMCFHVICASSLGIFFFVGRQPLSRLHDAAFHTHEKNLYFVAHQPSIVFHR